ncbi:MAG: glycosyltransferase [Candidatus Margulisiibacteriota bacterium]|nr:glycosyltransferase [Candidatus Margulisiibacteriota bacterium]
MKRILLVSSGYYRGEKTHIDQIKAMNNISFDLITNKQDQTSNESTYNFSLPSLIKIKKLIQINQYSCIHCHGFKASVFIRILNIVCKLPPIIYTIHGFHCAYKKWSLKAWIQRYLEKQLKHQQDHTICVSTSDQQSAIKHQCIIESKSSVICNGVSLSNHLNHASPVTMFNKDDIICISTGTLEWRKGFEVIIEAANHLKNKPNIKFVFIGDGPLKKELTNTIKQLKLSNQIYLAGYQSDVRAWLQHSDIYISASRWEGLPYGILEAFQYNLPTIASNAPGIRDCITHNKNGYLFELNNSNDLADKLMRLINDPNKQTQFIDESNRRLRNEFSKDNMIEQIQSIYEQYKT